MKKRNPVGVFFLSLITFGIYDIYWLVVTKKVLNQKTDTKIPTIWLMFGPALIAIVVLVVLFSTDRKLINTVPTTTTTTTVNSISTISIPSKQVSSNTTLLLAEIVIWIVILPISIYWLWKFSKAVDQYTNGKMNTAVSFLLLWLVQFIGLALIQDAFNDIETTPVGMTNSPMMQPTPQQAMVQPTPQQGLVQPPVGVAPSGPFFPAPNVINPQQPPTNQVIYPNQEPIYHPMPPQGETPQSSSNNTFPNQQPPAG